MEFSYCPDCGARLERRSLGDEIGVPWCVCCGRPWFAMFLVAVIALVYNDSGEVLLLRQNYISTEFHNLVSGYVKPGEDAESCVVREIMEETGLEVDSVRLVFTDWFAKKRVDDDRFFRPCTLSPDQTVFGSGFGRVGGGVYDQRFSESTAGVHVAAACFTFP